MQSVGREGKRYRHVKKILRHRHGFVSRADSERFLGNLRSWDDKIAAIKFIKSIDMDGFSRKGDHASRQVQECACHFRHIDTIPSQGRNGEINEISWQTSRGTCTRAGKREEERGKERGTETSYYTWSLTKLVRRSFLLRSRKASVKRKIASVRPWGMPW